MIADVRVKVRRFAPARDRELADMLWVAAMPPQWPLLPAAVAELRDGLVAETSSGPVGMVAIDPGGGVPLILVTPGCQRRGIGTKLLADATEVLRARGCSTVDAGSGGLSYIWPGVPRDCPGATEFFSACGWRYTHDVADLVADLRAFRSVSDARTQAAATECGIYLAGSADMDAVLRFERASFPSWARWFATGPECVLIARTEEGQIAGSLLLDGPGADTVLAPMLGPACGTIGCVGVAPALQGRGIGTAMVARASELLSDAGTGLCHIGWTTRESFYQRVGYQMWRTYAMFSLPI